MNTKNNTKVFLLRILSVIFAMLKIQHDDNKMEYLLQIIRFCVVGLLNTVISYIAYLLFMWFGLNYLVSSCIAFVVSTTNAYYWNTRYVFRVKRRWWIGLVKTYGSYALTGVVLYNALLFILVDMARLSKYIAPFFVLIVTIPCNFLLNKYWTFRSKD